MTTQRIKVLKRKIQREVNYQFAIENSNPLLHISGGQHILNSKKNYFTTLMWYLFIIWSIGLCSYQCYDRLDYYWSEPISVDNLLIPANSLQLPMITLCYNDAFYIFACTTFNIMTRPWCPSIDECIDVDLDGPIQNLYEKHYTDRINYHIRLFTNTKDYIIEPNITTEIQGMMSCLKLHFNEFGDIGHFTKMEIVTQVNFEKCSQAMFQFQVEDFSIPPSLRPAWYIGINIEAQFSVSLKKYYFMNRKDSRCSENAKFTECYQNCLLHSRSVYENATCRFPNMPKDIDLPECSPNDYEKTWEQSITFMIGVQDPITECKCEYPCESMGHSAVAQFATYKQNQSKFSVILENEFATIVKEKPAFLIIDLLCSCGGNLGFYLGYSLLNIFQVVYLTGKHVTLNLYSKEKFDGFLRQKVKKLLKIERSKIKIFPSSTVGKLTSHYTCCKFGLAKSMKILLLIFSSLMSVILIYNRIVYYLLDPTKNVVKVVRPAELIFPNLTVCAIGKELAEIKTKHNMSEQTEFLDLIDLEKIPVDILWRKSSIRRGLSSKKEMLLWQMQYVVGDSVNFNEVSTAWGLCTHVQTKPQKNTERHELIMEVNVPSVGNKHTKIFMESNDNIINYYSGIDIPLTSKVYIILNVRKVRRSSSRLKPCVPARDNAKCKHECLNKQLQSNLKCSLPFMETYDVDLSACNDSSSAKIARSTFFECYSKLIKVCSCLQPCEELIIEVEIRNDQQFAEKVVKAGRYLAYSSYYIVSFTQPFFEDVLAVVNYSFVQLVCDIGGVLGLFLAVSVLSLVDWFYSKFANICKKRHPKSTI